MKTRAEDHRDERDLPPVIQGDPAVCCSAIRRTGCSRAVRGSASSGDDPRPGAFYFRAADRKMGGPSGEALSARWSVQRHGLLEHDQLLDRDKGEGLWRRSLYTFWKRTVAPPTMQVFDASPRECCTVRESRTNTPLQALNLMNDVTYVEAARLLAGRMIHEGGSTPEERLAWAFRLVTSRRPDERRASSALVRNLEAQLDYSASFTRSGRVASVGRESRTGRPGISAIRYSQSTTASHRIIDA